MEEPIINENEHPESVSATPPDDSAPSALETERDEYRDGWQRAKADLANFKRLETERIASAIGHGMRSLSEDLLLVLDSFGLALATIEKGSAGEQGMSMIRSQLLEILKRYGVEPIAAGELVGQDYDPALAEAIGTMPTPDHADGTVVSVAQEGYRMNGKVLRPARVYLASNAQQ